MAVFLGVFERIEDGKLSVAKVTFGAEPKDYEVQREVKRQMQETGIGTKSQQALKLQQEKTNRNARSEAERKKKRKNNECLR